MIVKPAYQTLIAIITIVLTGIFFQYDFLNQFPEYIHNWAQCDRYALALGFLNNGGDFFHPQTYLLNNQFPGEFDVIRNTSITSVDFPVHDYLVSLVMRLFNTTQPWAFRVYTLSYSMLGLFFLYRLSGLFTSSFFKKIVVVLLATLSPVFMYYQAGFLPTTPSLANAVIALYFYFSYYKEPSKKKYILAVLFIALAALARLPFAIVLVAMIVFECLQTLKHKKNAAYKFISLVLSVACIFLYYQYNNYLRAHYGSLFLNYIIPASGYAEFKEFLSVTSARWAFHYFTGFHYIILAVAALFFIINLITKKITVSALEKKFILFVVITLLGCLMYYCLMTFQYLDHDYYFLDTFYLPVILLFVFFISKLDLHQNKYVDYMVNGMLLCLLVPVVWTALKNKHNTYLAYNANSVYSSACNFEGADIFLDALQIPASARILVMGADGPNNPLILMKRKGYTVMYPDSAKIERALKWPFDYVVLEDVKLADVIYPAYPSIKEKLYRIGSNQKISVFSKKNTNDRVSKSSFLGVNARPVLYQTKVSFDSIPPACTGIDSLGPFCYSGKKGAFLRSSTEWSFTHQVSNMPALNHAKSTLVFEGYFNPGQKAVSNLLLCVSVSSHGKEICFITNDLSKVVKPGGWQKQELLFELPQITEKEYELNVFMWNKGKNTLFYDDFIITIY